MLARSLFFPLENVGEPEREPESALASRIQCFVRLILMQISLCLTVRIRSQRSKQKHLNEKSTMLHSEHTSPLLRLWITGWCLCTPMWYGYIVTHYLETLPQRGSNAVFMIADLFDVFHCCRFYSTISYYRFVKPFGNIHINFTWLSAAADGVMKGNTIRFEDLSLIITPQFQTRFICDEEWLSFKDRNQRTKRHGLVIELSQRCKI